MSISLAAEAVIFAINSAIKMGRNAQRAYAKSIKAKSIILPLPKFTGQPTGSKAAEFFSTDDLREGGFQFLEKIERLKTLHDKFDLQGLPTPEEEEYVEYYKQLFEVLREDRESGLREDRIDSSDLVALLRIRQWETGKEPRNSPVKLLAGTLVEIGIDYFNQVPGALNAQSSFGQSMKHFLTALDDVNFEEIAEFKELAEQITPKLFVAAAETVGALSEHMASDPKVQLFIQSVSKGIADDIFTRSQNAPDNSPAHWGQLMLRSLIKNGGNYVFNTPADLLNTNKGVTDLIQSTGKVLMEAILDDPDKLHLKDGFNIDSLDRLVKTSLTVLADHPELVSGREGFRDIVIGVSNAMASAGIKDRPDLLPELARSILEHTAGNLDVVLDSPKAGGKHLLVMTIREFLQALTATPPPPHADGWKPTLSKPQIVGIAQNLLDEVVRNPEWVTEVTHEKTVLRTVLDATFNALASLPKNERLNADVVGFLLQNNIRAVATCQGLCEKITLMPENQEVVILNKGLDLVFSFVFTDKRVRPSERINMLTELSGFVVGSLLTKHPDSRGIQLIDLLLFKDSPIDFSHGFNRQLADQFIDSGLRILREYPALATSSDPLQRILSGVASALDASSFRQPGMFKELARLTLEHTGRNTRFIITSDTDEPRYLLVFALESLLAKLSAREDNQVWSPKLNGTEAVNIVQDTFDFLLQHPKMVTGPTPKDTVFSAVVNSVFNALASVPPQHRFSGDSLNRMLQSALRATARSPELLSKIKWASGEVESNILNKLLDIVFAYTFNQEARAADRIDTLDNLMEYVLDYMASKYSDQRLVMILQMVLYEEPGFRPIRRFQAGEAEGLIQAAFKVFAAHPDLVTRNDIIQKIVGDVADSLKATPVFPPDLFRELVRATLETTSENIHLLSGVSAESPRYLLADAIGQCLQCLSQPGGDRWKPEFRQGLVLSVVNNVLGVVVQNPDWVKNKVAQVALESIFNSLDAIPAKRSLPLEVVRNFISTGLKAVSFRLQWVVEVVKQGGNKKRLALNYAMNGLFLELYDENNQSAGTWTLTQGEVVTQVLDHYLQGLSDAPVTRDSVDGSLHIIREALEDINTNSGFSIDELLMELES